MANQKQVTKQSKTEEVAEEQSPEVTPERQAEIDALKAETDAMLDEIDAVLEQNANEFVSQYVQKGGQ